MIEAAILLAQVPPAVKVDNEATAPAVVRPQPTPPITVDMFRLGEMKASSTAKTTTWIVPDESNVDVRRIDPRTLVFTGKPGEYLIYEVGFDGSGEPKQFARKIVISGALPPGPEPGPGPAPGPVVIPSTKHGLAKLAYDNAVTLAPAAKAKAPALASSFRAVEAGIAAGAIKTQAALTTALTDGVKMALGDQSQAWMAWQKTILDRVVQVVNGASLLGKFDAARECLGEIAVGLDFVK